MSFKNWTIAILIFVLPLSLVSQNVKLWGNQIEYAGQTFKFLTFSDQITYSETQLAECIVDENGDFSCSFDNISTKYIFLRLGVYEAFIFVEPGKDYEIILPERKDKTIADELNPFFEPILYHLGLNNTSEYELNYQLAFFDEIYSLMGSSNLYKIYDKIKMIKDENRINDVDTVYSKKAYSKIVNNSSSYIYKNIKEQDISGEISKVDSLFSDVNIKFFNNFKRYKFAAYQNLSSNQKMKSISNNYYLDKEILYHNPAYMSLFNQVYKEYFIYFGRTEYGKKIYDDINKSASYSKLNETLKRDSILKNDTLRELVTLKCLYDEFYNDKFSRASMLTVLDSLAAATSVNEHKLIAKNIREKVTKLMVGYNPPAFELFDTDSNLISLETYKGKYVYIGFCTTISYACIKEFEMLRNLYDKHKDHFEIIMICLDESLAQMKGFVERKKYPFTFLHYGNQSNVFKDYDVRAFPTYYFVDKKGKLLISPAPSPGENVEFLIFQKMRANGDL